MSHPRFKKKFEFLHHFLVVKSSWRLKGSRRSCGGVKNGNFKRDFLVWTHADDAQLGPKLKSLLARKVIIGFNAKIIPYVKSRAKLVLQNTKENYSKSFLMFEHESKWFKMIEWDSKWSNEIQNDQTWFKMIENNSKWSVMIQNYSKWSNMMQNYFKWSNLIQNYSKWPNMIQNDPSWYKMICWVHKWSSRTNM